MWPSSQWQQWPLQQAMYQNMPADQVDWAALAKQWIQMKDQPSGDIHPELAGDELPPGVLLRANQAFEGRRSPGQSPWAEDIPLQSGTWNVSGDAPGPLAVTKETYDYGHVQPQPLAGKSYDYNHGATRPHPKQFQPGTSYNQFWQSHGNDDAHLPPEIIKQHRDSDFIPGINDEYAHHARAKPKMSWKPFPERVSAHPPDISLHKLSDLKTEAEIAAETLKRKQLPAWIREGLEKMERQKQKKMEQEKFGGKTDIFDSPPRDESPSSAKQSSPMIMTSMPSHELDKPNNNRDSAVDSSEYGPGNQIIKSPSPKRYLENKAPIIESKEDLIIQVRQNLTAILLEVTNEEIMAIAREVYQKALSKTPARQLVRSAALASIAGGLGGLTGYGSNSEDEEQPDEDSEPNSDEELQRQIYEKQRAFREKEKQIAVFLEEENRREIDNERNRSAHVKDIKPRLAAEEKSRIAFIRPSPEPDEKLEPSENASIPSYFTVNETAEIANKKAGNDRDDVKKCLKDIDPELLVRLQQETVKRRMGGRSHSESSEEYRSKQRHSRSRHSKNKKKRKRRHSSSGSSSDSSSNSSLESRGHRKRNSSDSSNRKHKRHRSRRSTSRDRKHQDYSEHKSRRHRHHSSRSPSPVSSGHKKKKKSWSNSSSSDSERSSRRRSEKHKT